MRKKQAELASRAVGDSAADQAGDPGMVKTEGWAAEPQLPGLVKPEAKHEVLPRAPFSSSSSLEGCRCQSAAPEIALERFEIQCCILVTIDALYRQSIHAYCNLEGCVCPCR